jgi:hypothetical protein
MDEDELEKIITEIVRRKNATPLDSAAREFYERQLRAIRYTDEGAGEIIEGADPMGWGSYCRPVEKTDHQGSVVALRPSRKSEFPS